MIHQWIDEIIVPLTSESSAKMPQIMPIISSRNEKPSNFDRHFDKMGDEMENEDDELLAETFAKETAKSINWPSALYAYITKERYFLERPVLPFFFFCCDSF